MVRYMLDQNTDSTMEKSPLAKAGVKVTPPDKYNGEQSIEALESFITAVSGTEGGLPQSRDFAKIRSSKDLFISP